MTRSSPETPAETLQQFNAALINLLKPNNPAARSLLAFIRRTLSQYQLSGRFSDIDIFVIAYLRGVEQLLDDSRQPIRNPKAWMRGTTLNIIREQSRKRQKDLRCLVEVTDNLRVPQVDSSIVDEDIDIVVHAFDRLDHEERKVIELKYLQGLAWQEVWEKLGERELTLSALRKRGQRALEHLRREYHKIKPPVDRSPD